jgi:hypothetical protein
MKAKKIVSILTAMAAVSAMAMSVSAADWSQCSYADNDPSTLKMISQSADGVVFTNSTTSPDICKARITLDKVLKNPEDYSKIAKMEWTVTYTGVTPELVAEAGLAGGTWATNKNSDGYQIEPENSDEDDNYIWDKDTYTTTDSVTFEDGAPEKDGELVFMDWSYSSIGEQGVNIAITDLKIYDASGNEIEQLGYGEWVDPDTLVDSEVASETAEETTDDTESWTKVGDDDITHEENAETGNMPVAVAVATLALSSAAAVAVKRRTK